MDAKVKRCREKADEHENLSDSELIKKIRRVDRDRAKYYRYYTGQESGNRANYDMCINTSSVPVKELAEALAHLFG
jgi:chloramphenicol 3-O-phosphotransferase